MAAPTDTIERELLSDLIASVEQRFADDEFMSDLYRALSNQTWHKLGGPEGHLALSWSRAEEVVNELRARKNAPPLTLAQTGGEGEVSEAVEQELGRLGWQHRPLDTSRHDDRHESSAPSPPPADTGKRHAPQDSHPRLTKSARHSGQVSGDRSGNNVG